MQEPMMNMLVVGATGGSGRATVEELLNPGREGASLGNVCALSTA